MKSFEQNHEADLIFGNINFIDKNDLIIGELKLTKINIENFLYEGISLPQPATFWKRNIHDKIGKINDKYYYCMDFDFFIRIAKFGKLIHTKEYLASFRIHINSKTSMKLNVWKIEREEIVKQYLKPNLTELYLINKKCLCRAQRILYYILQGDIIYVLKKCANRFRGITFWEELKL